MVYYSVAFSKLVRHILKAVTKNIKMKTGPATFWDVPRARKASTPIQGRKKALSLWERTVSAGPGTRGTSRMLPSNSLLPVR